MRLLLFDGLSRRFLLAFFHGAFEVLDSVAKALAKISQLAGTKEDEGDDEDNQQLRDAKFSTKHFSNSMIGTATGRETLAFRLTVKG